MESNTHETKYINVDNQNQMHDRKVNIDYTFINDTDNAKGKKMLKCISSYLRIVSNQLIKFCVHN